MVAALWAEIGSILGSVDYISIVRFWIKLWDKITMVPVIN